MQEFVSLLKKTMGKNLQLQKNNPCPLNGECLKRQLVYKSKVEVNNGTNQDYYGLSGTNFKERYSRQMTTFRMRDFEHETELSKFVWKLLDDNKTFNLEWEIKEYARKFKPGDKLCNLCIAEKTAILLADRDRTLNKD